jgi:hypothetical protein
MGISYAAIIASLGITATVAVMIIATQNGPSATIEAMIEKPLPASCSNGQQKHVNLTDSKSPVLQKLAEYEEVCKGAVADRLMTFFPMPTDSDEAREFARSAASELKEFSKHGISPLVVFEPSLEKKDILKTIRAGRHDQALEDYYIALKQDGVTDALMGTWVLFPEANTPSWNTTDPHDFAANVTKIATLQKTAFPESKVTVLLNSVSYPDYDDSWSRGEKKSLEPYMKDIPKNLVDSFGYQGFPYAPPASSGEEKQLQADQFLAPVLAIEAAKNLGVRDIWLNTGTFKTMHAKNPADQVTLSTQQRDILLKDVIKQVQRIQAQDFAVMVNLFSEDKTHTAEGVDWSYWKKGQQSKSTDTEVFDTFTRRLRANNTLLSLYDSNR